MTACNAAAAVAAPAECTRGRHFGLDAADAAHCQQPIPTSQTASLSRRWACPAAARLSHARRPAGVPAPSPRRPSARLAAGVPAPSPRTLSPPLRPSPHLPPAGAAALRQSEASAPPLPRSGARSGLRSLSHAPVVCPFAPALRPMPTPPLARALLTVDTTQSAAAQRNARARAPWRQSRGGAARACRCVYGAAGALQPCRPRASPAAPRCWRGRAAGRRDHAGRPRARPAAPLPRAGLDGGRSTKIVVIHHRPYLPGRGRARLPTPGRARPDAARGRPVVRRPAGAQVAAVAGGRTPPGFGAVSADLFRRAGAAAAVSGGWPEMGCTDAQRVVRCCDPAPAPAALALGPPCSRRPGDSTSSNGSDPK